MDLGNVFALAKVKFLGISIAKHIHNSNFSQKKVDCNYNSIQNHVLDPNKEWVLVAEKKECDGLEILFNDEESKNSIVDCANECKGKASMFLYGTNDFGNDRCSENGCSCSCEISATRGGTCNMVSHTGYRLYKFLDNGKYSLQNTYTTEEFKRM